MDETTNERRKMSYDITMCDNDQCVQKENCVRYVTYKKYVADKSSRKTPYACMNTYDVASSVCPIFWPIQ